MKLVRTRQETPILAYTLITISFIVGIVAANAQGQSPRPRQQVSGRLLPSPADDHQHVQRRWILGVRADASEAGYLVRHVQPHSAASRVGLEPGDRIVTIDGVQIGLIGRRSVRLSDTLERQGGHDGRVRLLVQDRRTARLVSIAVTLQHPSQHLGH